MLGGMISTVIWQNSATLGALLDIKAACPLISAALVIGTVMPNRTIFPVRARNNILVGGDERREIKLQGFTYSSKIEPTETDTSGLCEVSAVELAPSPGSLVDRGREIQGMLTALRRIPIDYQIILELYFWENLRATAVAHDWPIIRTS